VPDCRLSLLLLLLLVINAFLRRMISNSVVTMHGMLTLSTRKNEELTTQIGENILFFYSLFSSSSCFDVYIRPAARGWKIRYDE
jgi:hypothetical protein